MSNRLAGKSCLVTGAGSGIGLAIARSFLQEGARVAITGRAEAKLERAAGELGAPDRVLYRAADVTDVAQVGALVQQIAKQWGPVEILVNNAGINTKTRTFRELTPEIFEELVRVNLEGAFYCMHAVLPAMLERQDGVIINISSVAGKRALPLSGAAYAASKFGLTALGLCLGAEEKDTGIRVCNIYPGEVDTPLLTVRPQPLSKEHREKILQPEDIAAAALFVATLPPRVSIPELVIKPTTQLYL
jgi:NADP-dependent 3-hydroxy acid dehydrogenase YdfG